jgi:hypothetical protein
MTEQEKKVMNQIVELWNSFLQLPQIHEDDQKDFCYMIHRLQDMIAARQALLKYNSEV